MKAAWVFTFLTLFYAPLCAQRTQGVAGNEGLAIQSGPALDWVWLGLTDEEGVFRPLTWVPVVASYAPFLRHASMANQTLCLVSNAPNWMEVTECFHVDSLFHTQWRNTSRVDVAPRVSIELARTTDAKERWTLIDTYHQSLTDQRLREMAFAELSQLLPPLRLQPFEKPLNPNPDLDLLAKFFQHDLGKSLLTFRRDSEAAEMLAQIPGLDLADLHFAYKCLALACLNNNDKHMAIMLLSKLERSTPNDLWVITQLKQLYQEAGVSKP